LTILRLKYIQKFKDRHGRTRYYLRRKGMKTIKLPDIADAGFLAAYQAALSVTRPDQASRSSRNQATRPATGCNLRHHGATSVRKDDTDKPT